MFTINRITISTVGKIGKLIYQHVELCHEHAFCINDATQNPNRLLMSAHRRSIHDVEMPALGMDEHSKKSYITRLKSNSEHQLLWAKNGGDFRSTEVLKDGDTLQDKSELDL
ncbi:hypothetical protein scyTo_0010737 [Scyliorhinus torazame]|uniref:Uncharacterized protein n=1 Tax=Scyliorhinus torazame TaxID=75743 RepID=A0A401PAX7_SCYTO|nr:hypothetical protein [Scyliorhinus torazame]